ncbi:hypothetical protein PROFUN_02875 [Planoprotostelium fungivorum]|uniref:non-specific serine/threonine protein kinase n=1 Tax=Planoprotostelium fungivorum TaxID=1890364 RepID=A0A2P6NRZ6_9EUKA|nr:hypothetical protein PROFUN_02875 [Planoprotostelium fungivorum]
MTLYLSVDFIFNKKNRGGDKVYLTAYLLYRERSHSFRNDPELSFNRNTPARPSLRTFKREGTYISFRTSCCQVRLLPLQRRADSSSSKDWKPDQGRTIGRIVTYRGDHCVIYRWSFALSGNQPEAKERPEDVTYSIRVDDGEEMWNVERTYGAFKLLHFQIIAEFPNVLLSLPASIAANADTPEEREMRRIELSKYLEEVLSHRDVADTKYVQQFMTEGAVSKFPAYLLSSDTVKLRSKGNNRRRNVLYWVDGMKLEATADYQAKHPDEVDLSNFYRPHSSSQLSFSRGDIITFLGDKDEMGERIRGQLDNLNSGWVPASCVDVSARPLSPITVRPRTGSTSSPAPGRDRATAIFSAPNSPGIHHRDGNIVSNLKQKFEPTRNKSDPTQKDHSPPPTLSPPSISYTSPGDNILPPTKIFSRFSLGRNGRPRSGSSEYRDREFMPFMTTFTSDLDAINKILEAKEEISLPSPNDVTRQQVSNCKRFFKEYYQTMGLEIIQRKERQQEFERELSTVADEAKRKSMTEAYRRKETNILRNKRAKQSLEDFEVIDMIGRGGFGRVFLCRIKATGALVALKKIKKSVILERNKLESLLTEREVLTLLNRSESPWLIKLVCSFQDDLHFYFAMEFASGGNLKNLLETRMLTEIEAKFYICEMIAAVNTLHKLGFVHRDLKPDNFLFDSTGHVKLADFGLSKGGILKRMDITGKDQVKLRSVRIYLRDGTFRTLALQEMPTTGYAPVSFDSELTPSPYVDNVVHTMVKKLDIPQRDSDTWQLYEVKPSGEHRCMDPDEVIFNVPGMNLNPTSPGMNVFSIHEVKGAERHYFLFKETSTKEPRRNNHNMSPNLAAINKAAAMRSKRVSVMYAAHKVQLDTTNYKRQSVRLDINEMNKRREAARASARKEAMYSFVGSPYYMAPEIITRNGYDELVDWWSLGCILYEMIIGFPPFMGDTPHEVFDCIVDHENELQFPDEQEALDEDGAPIEVDLDISMSCKDLIRSLLSSAHKRIGMNEGFDEIKGHPFFDQVEWTSLRSKTPPFQPELSGPEDTSYFRIDENEKLDTIICAPARQGDASQAKSPTRAIADEERAPRRVASMDLLVGFSFISNNLKKGRELKVRRKTDTFNRKARCRL